MRLGSGAPALPRTVSIGDGGETRELVLVSCVEDHGTETQGGRVRCWQSLVCAGPGGRMRDVRP